MTTFDQYGLLGSSHSAIIDTYLQRIPPKAFIVGLGCGPTLATCQVNLARTVARNTPGNALLIFADIREQSVRDASHRRLRVAC